MPCSPPQHPRRREAAHTCLRRRAASSAVVMALALLVCVGCAVAAQTPTPTPQSVTIPGQTTLAPGQSVTFRRPSDGATLTVAYGGGLNPVMLTYDGDTLTATVPPLGAFESLDGGDACAHVNN